ncbi:MAG: VWA domain-containing protein [Lachnospiraceae bacterium]|nr:VWA domain-containing protein [Lachnospiraceae bacterium]
MKMKRLVSLITAVAVTASLTACGDIKTVNDLKKDALSYEDAAKELDVFVDEISPTSTTPRLDTDLGDDDIASSLADIDTFEITTEGNGSINIEIAAPSEISGETKPDNWLNIMAEKFNKERNEIGDETVSVTVRKISSGEVVTYMADGGYMPDAYIPSNEALGEMLEASGISTIKVADRIAGNTAGILMKKSTNDDFVKKYGEINMKNVLEAATAGDLVFAYTNPYTSATGLNILTSMLSAFDSSNPLSETAVSKLTEYQKNAPTAAYTTGVLRNSAAKGIVDAMVMEEQAYINTPELKDYVFTPAGIRHDHPVYTFDYVDPERQEAVKLFTDYCLTDEAQKAASKAGFNRNDEYISQESGLDGAGYLAAQKVWKQNKNGGKPVVAVFVADVSGSMDGTRLNSLKASLINTMQYIDSSNYIGLVSYSDTVNVELPIGQFDNKQRAYFSGAVKDLTAAGGTATYDGVLVGIKMLEEYKKEVPNCKPMLFVLSDGAQNVGFTLKRVTPIVGGLSIPIYTIGYEMTDEDKESLQQLSDVNEAACIDADVDGIVNDLRNLFNVNM